MYRCPDCAQEPQGCICAQVEDFFEENAELMEDLAELEAQENGGKRCLACFFFNCQCMKALRGKR